MKLRRSGAVRMFPGGVALFLLFAAAVAAPPQFQLPEIVASRGEETVRRAEIEPALRAEPLASHLVLHPDETLPTVRRLAEQKLGMKILLSLLRARKIPVDAETAQRYIERHTRRFGALPSAQRLRVQLEALAGTPQFQLKAALHRYFEETVPRAVEVTDLELERAYRFDQKRFLQPPKLDCGVIAVRRDRGNADEIAGSAAARLRQGAEITALFGETAER